MFAWLGYNALAAVPFALLALLAGRFMRRYPGVVHLLWLAVIVRLVLPPVPRIWPLTLLWGSPADATAAGPALISSESSFLNTVVTTITRTFGTNWSFQALKILLVIFSLVGLWLLVGELRRLVRLRRCLRTSFSDPEAQARTRGVAQRLGIKPPPVRRTDAISTPCVLGFVRPVLLLPTDDETPNEVVLAHELAHLRRKDHLAGWLDLVVLCLHFWNPLFWFARRRMYLAAEWACDAWALTRYPTERTPYAKTLVDAVERASFAPVAPSALRAVGVGAPELEERLSRILAGEDAARTPRLAAWLVGISLVASVPGVLAPSIQNFREALPSLPSGLSQETWERYLEQGNALMATDPGLGEFGRGMGLLGLGRLDEAAEAFERQIELGHAIWKGHYNAACAHTRAGRFDEAFDHLEAAAEGVDVAELFPRDPDLAPLHSDPRAAELLRRLRE